MTFDKWMRHSTKVGITSMIITISTATTVSLVSNPADGFLAGAMAGMLLLLGYVVIGVVINWRETKSGEK